MLQQKYTFEFSGIENMLFCVSSFCILLDTVYKHFWSAITVSLLKAMPCALNISTITVADTDTSHAPRQKYCMRGVGKCKWDRHQEQVMKRQMSTNKTNNYTLVYGNYGYRKIDTQSFLTRFPEIRQILKYFGQTFIRHPGQNEGWQGLN